MIWRRGSEASRCGTSSRCTDGARPPRYRVRRGPRAQSWLFAPCASMPNASRQRGHHHETDTAHRDRTTRGVVQDDSVGGGVRRGVHRPDPADADSLAASHRRAVHAGPPCPRRHAPAPRLQRGDVSRGPPAARHGNANRDRIDMGRRPVRRGDCARHRGSKQPLLRVLRLRGAGGRVPGPACGGR